MSEAPPSKLSTRLLFVTSAATAAITLRVAWDRPDLGIVVLVSILAVVGSRWVARRRSAKALRSGDVGTVLQRWSSAMDRVPHAETMGPLMTATALAAYGWVRRAREVLQHAQRGPAWEAALEHRLFLDTLLLTFEGRSDQALQHAARLQDLPLPTSLPFLAPRVITLRRAVAALARAFAHNHDAGDRQLMIEAGDSSPLIHWAMRYGAAIIDVDAGQLVQAQALIAGAPDWPSESCFRNFHEEIAAEVERREQTSRSPSETQQPDPAGTTDHVLDEDGRLE